MDNPNSWNHKNPGKHNREARRAVEAQVGSRYRVIVAITTAGLAALSENQEAQPQGSNIQRILRYIDEVPRPAKKPRTAKETSPLKKTNAPSHNPATEPHVQEEYTIRADYVDGSSCIEEEIKEAGFQSLNYYQKPAEVYLNPNTGQTSLQNEQETSYSPAIMARPPHLTSRRGFCGMEQCANPHQQTPLFLKAQPICPGRQERQAPPGQNARAWRYPSIAITPDAARAECLRLATPG
ncbi:hypothetical protein DFP73DRAFT_607613 [Morchella snyderi]|nr:hypothetical protein DFP73DRAFT_607613 [Morchella snyderi]